MNQDALLIDGEAGLYLVADGMGGHSAGEVASALAIESVHDFVRRSRLDRSITWPFGYDAAQSYAANQLRNAIHVAHRRILAHGRTHDLEGMGTTFVAVLAGAGCFAAANVGDSRLYLHRGGVLTQLSVDHTWAADALRDGMDPEVVRTHPKSHMVTNALGVGRAFHVAVREVELVEGDTLLLCSDGLHGLVDDVAIGRVLGHQGLSAEAQADSLIGMANEAGGLDNITALIARYENQGGQS